MNTNGNVYTIVYSTVLVILVAAILSIVSISLQPKQNENVKMETISKVLTAAAASTPEFTVAQGSEALAQYAEDIVDAYYIDGNAAKVGSMNTGKEDLSAIEVPSTSDLKRQNEILKKIEAGNAELSDLKLPVFVFDIKGETITVIPCYGAGLWGPIWGYLAVKSDGKTIAGAIFDHKSETPGLGGKIAEEPFYSQFAGKQISDGDEKFSVVKGGAGDNINGVDAISGATITSRSLGVCLNLWIKYYEPYLNSIASKNEEE